MRSSVVWLVTLPLALAGCEIGHALADAVNGTPAGSGAELFGAAGASSGLVVPLTAVGACLLIIGLVSRLTGGWTSPGRGVSALPFACLAPGVFVVQEHLELLFHTGVLPVGAVLEPTFLPGLALQLPFALAAFLIARALLRLADGVRRLIARGRSPRVARVLFARAARPVVRPRVRRAGPSHSGRAPPFGSIASG